MLYFVISLRISNHSLIAAVNVVIEYKSKAQACFSPKTNRISLVSCDVECMAFGQNGEVSCVSSPRGWAHCKQKQERIASALKMYSSASH